MVIETAAHLGATVAQQLDSLTRWATLPVHARESVAAAFRLFTAESLDRPCCGPFGGLSFINASGLPFQWVLRFSSAGAGFGFVCEAGRPGESAQRRLEASLESCEALHRERPAWLRAVAGELVKGEWPAHWRSAMWVGLAASAAGVSLKPYFNLNRGTPRERWMRAGAVLRMLGRERSLGRLCELSGTVSRDSWPVGLAVDILCDGRPGRVKIYFRSGSVDAAWLKRWYLATGFEGRCGMVRRCLDLFPWIGSKPYPEGAFTVSLEFHPCDEQVSLKTDLAVTKWLRDECAIAGAKGLVAAACGHGQDLQDALAAIGAGNAGALRFVGLGLEPDGSAHVNVYVEPPVAAAPATVPRPPSRSRAIAAGLRFLLANLVDGHWTDFQLPVGSSDRWVTAYVLAQLAGVSCDRGPIDAAIDWLAAAQTPGGGWSYNAHTADDADSTAWAVIALRRHGRPVPSAAMDVILSCCQGDGGVATYPAAVPPGGAWSSSVPDVSAVASIALQTAMFLGRWRREGLPAYWWASPFYTAAMLRDSAVLPSNVAPTNSFDLALALQLRYNREWERELLHQQQADGGWPASALLRLTSPAVACPWDCIDPGPLFVDQARVFTTATAVAALSRYSCSRIDISACE